MITIKDLFEYWDVTRQDVCSGLQIPYRTLQNWLTGTRKCPDYVVLLLDEWMSHHCVPRNMTLRYIDKLEHELSKVSALLQDLQATYYEDDNIEYISDEEIAKLDELAELVNIEDLI